MRAFRHFVGNYVYWRTFVTTPDGKRKPIQAKTKREAERKAIDEQRKHRVGLDPDAGQATVESFMKQFLDFITPDGTNEEAVAPSVYADYRYHSEKHICPLLGRIRVQKITTRDVDHFLKTKAESGLAPATVDYTHRVLRRALNFAVDWGVIERNPASARVRSAKRRKRRESKPETLRYFTPAQAESFVEAVEDDRHEALFIVALTTGARPGELFGLQWGDLKLDSAAITIQRALHRTKRRKNEEGESWFLRSPKTPGSRRTVRIPEVAVDALRRQRERQRQQRMLAGDRWSAGGFVFATEKGTPLDVSNVLHHFQRICAANRLPKLRFYDLRHTHASLLIHEGMHPKLIAERLGHSSIKLTMDTYGHLFEGSDRGAAEAMDKLLKPQHKVRTGKQGNVVAIQGKSKA